MIKIIEISNLDKQEPLLDEAYNNILLKAFPNSDELDSLESIKYNLLKIKEENIQYSLYILAALLDNKVVGCLIGYYFTDSNSSLILYIATHSSFRRKGVSKALIDYFYVLQQENAIKRGKDSIDYVFIECENPLMLEEDKEGMIKRIEYWKHMGFSQLDFNYIQAPLEVKKSPIYFLNLFCCKINKNLGNTISREFIFTFLHDYQKYYLSIENPYENEYFINMQKHNNSKFYKINDKLN